MLVKRRLNLVATVLIFSILSIYNVIAILKVRTTLEPTSKIIGIKDDQYIDEFGRQRFFRGLNVVCIIKNV
jgi:hypothetical protein